MVWGSIEARCLRRRVLEARLAGLPAQLDGLTILHLSDVHAGHGPGLAMLGARPPGASSSGPT